MLVIKIEVVKKLLSDELKSKFASTLHVAPWSKDLLLECQANVLRELSDVTSEYDLDAFIGRYYLLSTQEWLDSYPTK